MVLKHLNSLMEQCKEHGVNQQIAYEAVKISVELHYPNESHAFPSYDSLRSIMSRFSKKHRPRDPILETIETFDIPVEYRTTLGENGVNFIIHRICIPNPQQHNRLEGYVVLGDPQLIHQLINSNFVATDGTFAIAPPPFLQLTSFVFFFTNIHNIRKAFCGIHVLFTSKTRFIYEHFLNWLVTIYNINNIRWEHLMMDHEEAMISALHIHLPAVHIHLCYFHVGQAIQRWVSHHGLQVYYNEEHSTLKVFLRFIRALGLLPINDVMIAYQVLLDSDHYQQIIIRGTELQFH